MVARLLGVSPSELMAESRRLVACEVRTVVRQPVSRV
jgi:hypothetical protein